MSRPHPTPSVSLRHPSALADTQQTSKCGTSIRSVPSPLPERLLTIHHLAAHDIVEADHLGGLPSPSLGITRLDTPFLGFGEISLIGTRDMADPRHTPVYPCDASTPSAPRSGRNRKLRAANLTEATARMVSSAARRRRGPYNLDRLLAEVGGRFATPEDIQAARDRLVDSDTARDEREYLGGLLDAYVRSAARCHSDQHASQQSRESAAMKALAHAWRHGASRESLGAALARRRFTTAPASVLNLGERVICALRTHVTDYFEAKPTRSVALREFAGAVVPADTPAEVIRILRRTGLRLKRYKQRGQASSIKALALELSRDRPDILYRDAVFRHPGCGSSRRARMLANTWRVTLLGVRLSQACLLLPPAWQMILLCGLLLRHKLGLCLLHLLAEALSTR